MRDGTAAYQRDAERRRNFCEAQAGTPEGSLRKAGTQEKGRIWKPGDQERIWKAGRRENEVVLLPVAFRNPAEDGPSKVE